MLFRQNKTKQNNNLTCNYNSKRPEEKNWEKAAVAENEPKTYKTGDKHAASFKTTHHTPTRLTMYEKHTQIHCRESSQNKGQKRKSGKGNKAIKRNTD